MFKLKDPHKIKVKYLVLESLVALVGLVVMVWHWIGVIPLAVGVGTFVWIWFD